jgi:hypothetical protein
LQSQSEPVDTNDHIDFIASYGKMLDDERRYNLELKKNKTEQTMTAELMQKCKEKLATLQAEEKKRLRESLSETERAFLSYGIEIRKGNSKRAKLGEEISSDGDNAEE